ncbi:MAG: transcriptional repressor [Ruminococcaceae bacterium]|nr:transcriptional repressor [Oscillospiraceae bacterium]
MRNTMQKDIIKNALISLANHPTADEVYDFIHKDYPSISRATVYRVLNVMAQSGSAKRYVSTSGADFFDHQTYNHYHLKCENCQRVYDMEIPFMDNLNHNSDKDVTVFSHQIIFNGLCKKCNNKGD